MVRPRKNRIVAFDPDVNYFKPRGIPMVELQEVCLTVDECESIRLADLLDMSYEEAGKHMEVSRATFGRIVQQARKIIADALINGKAINIEGGNYRINEEERIFMCCKCNNKWEEPWGTGMPHRCPSCDHDKYLRVWKKK
ncbi:MAG: DUF134 domain-containing protein [Thermodesulfobacteriota bacterium]|nr:DUF134 domain-containing protein [Thermodesulfobacteriota bacterium]